MMRVRMFAIASLLLVAFVASAGPAWAPELAPGEYCETNTVRGWRLEICGAMATSGLGELTAHQGECRASIIETGDAVSDDDPDQESGVRVPIATGIRHCTFFKDADPDPMGPNQRLATPDPVTAVSQNFGTQDTGDICVVLEGFALFTDTTEIQVADGETCHDV